jgi:hypothetical protein
MASTKKSADSLLALADLLSDGDESVRVQVQLALDEPAAYLKKYAKRLAERAITKPKPNLAWIALVDGLASKKRLAEIDHSTFAEDAAFALEKLATLPKKKNRFDWVDDLDDPEDLSTEDFLGMTAKRLAAEKLALVMLDMQSDAFPIVVVAAKAVAKVASLAKDAGYMAKAIDPLDAPADEDDDQEDDDDEDDSVPEWRIFVRGQDTWAIKQGATQLMIDAGPLGGSTKMSSMSLGAGKVAAEAKKQIASKVAEGFAEVSQKEYERLEAEATKSKKK